MIQWETNDDRRGKGISLYVILSSPFNNFNFIALFLYSLIYPIPEISDLFRAMIGVDRLQISEVTNKKRS